MRFERPIPALTVEEKKKGSWKKKTDVVQPSLMEQLALLRITDENKREPSLKKCPHGYYHNLWHDLWETGRTPAPYVRNIRVRVRKVDNVKITHNACRRVEITVQ